MLLSRNVKVLADPILAITKRAIVRIVSFCAKQTNHGHPNPETGYMDTDGSPAKRNSCSQQKGVI